MAPHRILIFIVAYNAEKTLSAVLDRIPHSDLAPTTEILVIDDSSQDKTFQVGVEYKGTKIGVPLTVLRTPVNQGYGGNQKLGYRYAIEKGFDVVALVHGDGQYPPEMLPALIRPLLENEAEAVFGSRMLKRGAALRGGMPLYKYVGNKILTTLQNTILHTKLSEFHSGYRAYSVAAIKRVPFECNSNDFHFDTDIIIQFVRQGFRIKEIVIPTYYGDEICYVNGLKYAWNVLKSTVLSRFQDLGLFYQRKFDSSKTGSPYELKIPYTSSHTMAIEAIQSGNKVLDIGCGPGYLANELRVRKNCHVTGVDRCEADDDVLSRMDHFVSHNLDSGRLPANLGSDYDVVLMLDLIEHLRFPEKFLDDIRHCFGATWPKLIITTGNVAFLPIRLSLLMGAFNYGRRGILDMTHSRLFTFGTLCALLDQAGFQVKEMQGIPAPFPLALGNTRWARLLLLLNKAAITISRTAFSYQIYAEATVVPPVTTLLKQIITTSESAVNNIVVRVNRAPTGSLRNA
ncbi:MAG: glycosyltransferase [Deltaproteobacteria bacterium]|nr:glycosyltransferase [Deltaproteobacteria bacterium]